MLATRAEWNYENTHTHIKKKIKKKSKKSKKKSITVTTMPIMKSVTYRQKPTH